MAPPPHPAIKSMPSSARIGSSDRHNRHHHRNTDHANGDAAAMEIAVNASAIVEILDLLGFSRFIAKHAPPKTQITAKSFEKLRPLEFRLIYYHLFSSLSGEKARSRFRSVFPSKDIQQETEFRKIAVLWLDEIKHKFFEPVDKIPMIHFQRLSGAPFVEITALLAILALEHKVSKLPSLPSNDEQKPENFLESCLSTIRPEEKVEEDLGQFSDENLQLKQMISYSNEKLDFAHQRLSDRLERQAREHAELFRCYRSSQFIEQVNDRLRQDLSEIVDQLEARIEFVQSLAISSTSSILDHRKPTGQELLHELNQLLLVVDLYRRDSNRLLKAVKNYKKISKVEHDCDLMAKEGEKICDRLRERLAQEKGRLFALERAKCVREQILHDFAPTFGLKLSFDLSPQILRRMIDSDEQQQQFIIS